MADTIKYMGTNAIRLLDDPVNAFDIACIIAKEQDKQIIEDPFMVVNLDDLLDRYQLWTQELPKIQPYYAVKCNTDPVLVESLAALGAGFDCASKEEIDIVTRMGVEPSRIIYANPCKSCSFISHARKCNVSMMTFDSEEELEKIALLYPNARLILRIDVPDHTAMCPLTHKFGADPETDAPYLLKIAREFNLNVVGISFHVGSGCNDAATYTLAISHARHLVDFGTNIGFHMNLIDIGGGFPGVEHELTFKKIAAVVRDAITVYFSEDNFKIIAEPGRFFATTPFSLVLNVIHAKRVPAENITNNLSDCGKKGYMYYLNDGVYGSFDSIRPHNIRPTAQPLFNSRGKKFISTLWGPTCDSLDKIAEKQLFPKFSVGDWLLFANMGAYSTAASTTFNGFQRPTPIYVISRDKWDQIRNSSHIVIGSRAK